MAGSCFWIACKITWTMNGKKRLLKGCTNKMFGTINLSPTSGLAIHQREPTTVSDHGTLQSTVHLINGRLRALYRVILQTSMAVLLIAVWISVINIMMSFSLQTLRTAIMPEFHENVSLFLSHPKRGKNYLKISLSCTIPTMSSVSLCIKHGLFCIGMLKARSICIVFQQKWPNKKWRGLNWLVHVHLSLKETGMFLWKVKSFKIFLLLCTSCSVRMPL